MASCKPISQTGGDGDGGGNDRRARHGPPCSCAAVTTRSGASHATPKCKTRRHLTRRQNTTVNSGRRLRAHEGAVCRAVAGKAAGGGAPRRTAVTFGRSVIGRRNFSRCMCDRPTDTRNFFGSTPGTWNAEIFSNHSSDSGSVKISRDRLDREPLVDRKKFRVSRSHHAPRKKK
jgi:hypothetical protein